MLNLPTAFIYFWPNVDKILCPQLWQDILLERPGSYMYNRLSYPFGSWWSALTHSKSLKSSRRVIIQKTTCCSFLITGGLGKLLALRQSSSFGNPMWTDICGQCPHDSSRRVVLVFWKSSMTLTSAVGIYSGECVSDARSRCILLLFILIYYLHWP